MRRRWLIYPRPRPRSATVNGARPSVPLHRPRSVRNKSWTSVSQFIQLLQFIIIPFVHFLQLRRFEKSPSERIRCGGECSECEGIRRPPAPPTAAQSIRDARQLRRPAIRAAPSAPGREVALAACFGDVRGRGRRHSCARSPERKWTRKKRRNCSICETKLKVDCYFSNLMFTC